MDIGKLHNLANIDGLIGPLKTKDNRTYQALHNIQAVLQNLLITTQGVGQPDPHFIEKFYIPTLATGVVPIPYLVKMPSDTNWSYNSLTIDQISGALVTAGSTDTVVDILVSATQGTTAFKSILQSTKLTLSNGIKVRNANIFNIATFYDGDLFEVNITSVGTGAVGLELTFRGSYNIVPK